MHRRAATHGRGAGCGNVEWTLAQYSGDHRRGLGGLAVPGGGSGRRPGQGQAHGHARDRGSRRDGAEEGRRSSFEKGKANQKVGVGDTIQTDTTGLAEITFKDGSLTRLDHDTIFTLGTLVNTTGQRQVEGTVSTGQTWNRVQKLSGTEKFEQNGNGATAAVIGTAFVTKCSLPSGTAFTVVKTRKQLKKPKSSKCDFTLVDGKLTLTSLGKIVGVNRGQSAAVGAAGNAGDRPQSRRTSSTATNGSTRT